MRKKKKEIQDIEFAKPSPVFDKIDKELKKLRKIVRNF